MPVILRCSNTQLHYDGVGVSPAALGEGVSPGGLVHSKGIISPEWSEEKKMIMAYLPY